jgi:putative phosphoesterase
MRWASAGAATPTDPSEMPPTDARPQTIGLISDTHGLLRPDALTALAGVDHILHAGDVGGDEILDELAAIAPVSAVYGNTDDPRNPRLAEHVEHRLGELRIHVSHGHEVGSPSPERLAERYAADVIVYGHTHRSLVERRGDVLIVNPGAAGPRRFNLLPSVALLWIAGGRPEIEIISLRP